MSQNQLPPDTPGTVPPELRERFAAFTKRRLIGRKTVNELRSWGQSGIRLLAEAAYASDYDVSEWAIIMLGRLAGPETIPVLIELFAHENRGVQLEVAKILKLFGIKAIQPLLDSLPHAAPQQRQGILLALGELGDPVATPQILPELEHNDPGIRVDAAIALKDLKDTRAVPALTARLADPDAGVRGRVVDALQAISDPQAVPALVTALHTDSDHDVRIWIIEALGKLGDARAVDPLLTHLSVSDAEERARTAEALGLLGNPRAVEPLIIALRDSDPDVRAKVAEALGEIGNPRALEPLRSFLSHPDQALTLGDISVQAYVVLALGLLDGEQIQVDLLRAVNIALHMNDNDACWAAVMGLGEHGDVQALPVLQQIAVDPNPRETVMGDLTAEEAAEAIEKILQRLDSASE